MADRVRIEEGKLYRILKVAEELTGRHHLHKNQLEGLKEIFAGNNVADISATGSGKTVIAAAALLHGLEYGKISIYLVPTSALRDMKYRLLKDKIDAIYGDKAPLIIPLKDYLRKTHIDKGNMIIIATPEKFAAEYERLRIQRGVYGRKKISVVVLDEAHILGDEKRGGGIEVLLRRIRYEHNSQLVFLSATFPSIEYWAREFSLKILPEYEIKREVIRKLRIARTPEEKEDFLKEDILEAFNSKKKGVILVFCASRSKTEYLAKIVEGLGFKVYSIHGYKSREENQKIIAQLKRGKHKKVVLFSTTLLMPGIDIRDIHLIIFYDVEVPFFTGNRLLQGEGRSRERKVTVKFYALNMRDDENFLFYLLSQKLIFDENQNIIGYRLSPIFSQVDDSDVLRAIMAYVIIGAKTKKKIARYLKDIGLGMYLDALDEFLSNKFIFHRNNMYSLTELGKNLLLTYINPTESNIFVSKAWKELTVTQKIIKLYNLAIEPIEKKKFEDKLICLINHLLNSKRESFEIAARRCEISEGQIPGLRKQIAWISASLLQIVENDKEKEVLKRIYQISKTYPTRPKTQFFKKKVKRVSKKKAEELRAKIVNLLKAHGNGLSLSEISEKLGLSKQSAYWHLEKLVLEGTISKRSVKTKVAGRPTMVYFSEDTQSKGYSHMQCKHCIFKTERVSQYSKSYVCVLRKQQISPNMTACKDFIRNPRSRYYVIDDWDQETCVVCGKKMDNNVICNYCGSVYIPKLNGHYKVLPGITDLRREKLGRANYQNLKTLPNYIHPSFTVFIYRNDILKVRGTKIYLKRYNRSSVIDLRFIKRVIFFDGREPDQKLKAILSSFEIPYIIKSEISESLSGKQLREKLQNLNLKSKSVINTIVAKITCEALSNLTAMKLIYPYFNLNKWKIRKFVDAILSNVAKLHLRYMLGEKRISIFMAYEGNIKRLFWEYLRYIVSNEKIRFLTPRVVSRYINAKFRGGTKSPFHATLNYFYQLLSREARQNMKAFGFSYNQVGQGLLHRRNAYNRNDNGLLYDFIDMFRPLYIYLNYSLWKAGILKEEDVESLLVSTVGKVYYVSRGSEYKLKKWFRKILGTDLRTKYGLISLEKTLEVFARDLALWVLHQKPFPLFIYVPAKEYATLLLNLTQPLEKALHKSRPWRRVNRLLKKINAIDS